MPRDVNRCNAEAREINPSESCVTLHEGLFDDVPEMSSAPAAPRRLYYDSPVFRTRKGACQNLLGAPQVFASDVSPFANPEE